MAFQVIHQQRHGYVGAGFAGFADLVALHKDELLDADLMGVEVLQLRRAELQCALDAERDGRAPHNWIRRARQYSCANCGFTPAQFYAPDDPSQIPDA